MCWDDITIFARFRVLKTTNFKLKNTYHMIYYMIFYNTSKEKGQKEKENNIYSFRHPPVYQQSI